jgi:phosphomannomutase
MPKFKSSMLLWHLTGNETAALLGWWIIKKEKGAQESGGKEAEEREAEMKNCFMLSSTVSSMILKTMAKAEGFQFEETLTGFKWMGSRAKQLMNMGHKVRIFAQWSGICSFLDKTYTVISRSHQSRLMLCGQHLANLLGGQRGCCLQDVF